MINSNQNDTNDVKSVSKIITEDFTNSNITVQKTSEDKEKKDKIKDDKIRIIWDQPTENLLSSWADIATCYNWMHDISFRKFQKKNFRFSLPVIILSTLTGTLNLALQGYVPQAYINYAQAGIGSVNIFTGILTTLQNYFRYAENSESHKNASIGWSKLQRNISIELSYKIKSRKDADTFVKVCRMEYDRLLEQSPIVPSNVIEIFKKDFIRDHDSKLITPDVCGQLKHTEAYKEVLVENDSQTESIKVIPEIRDTLLDRIINLEKNMGIMSQTKSMQQDTVKNINDYSSVELMDALDRKNSVSEDNMFSNISTKRIDSEVYVQNVVKRSLEPVIMGAKNENVFKRPFVKNYGRGAEEVPVDRPNIKDLISKFQTNGFHMRTSEGKVDNFSEVKNEPVVDEKFDEPLNEKFNTPLKLIENVENSLSRYSEKIKEDDIVPKEEKPSGRGVKSAESSRRVSRSVSSVSKKSVSSRRNEKSVDRVSQVDREGNVDNYLSESKLGESVTKRASAPKTRTKRGNTKEFVNDIKIDVDKEVSDFVINVRDEKSLGKEGTSKKNQEKSNSKYTPQGNDDTKVELDGEGGEREDSVKLVFVDTDDDAD